MNKPTTTREAELLERIADLICDIETGADSNTPPEDTGPEKARAYIRDEFGLELSGGVFESVAGAA